jgi:hypothetical protein
MSQGVPKHMPIVGIVSAVGDRSRPEVHRLNAALIYSKVHPRVSPGQFAGRRLVEFKGGVWAAAQSHPVYKH